jgi:DNA-directed RNA polymerase-3 subunit RPC5
MVEVDTPLDIHHAYDRQKGVRFGEALKKARALGQDSYGASAGFQRIMPRPPKASGSSSAAGAAGAEENEAETEEAANAKALAEQEKLDKYVRDFDDANDKGHVLNKTTWAGHFTSQESWKPNYFVGTFRGNQVHMTRLDGRVLLQPTQPHLDAVEHMEIASRHREAAEAKDILPTVNKAPEELTTADLFRQAAQEPWNRYKWIDRTSEAAQEVREKTLYVQDTSKLATYEWESTQEYMDRLLPTGAGTSRKSRKAKHEVQW